MVQYASPGKMVTGSRSWMYAETAIRPPATAASSARRRRNHSHQAISVGSCTISSFLASKGWAGPEPASWLPISQASAERSTFETRLTL